MTNLDDALDLYLAVSESTDIYAAIAVCALFNLMNRLVEGRGCSSAAEAAGEDEHEPLMSYLA